jgi:hypothetical protein
MCHKDEGRTCYGREREFLCATTQLEAYAFGLTRLRDALENWIALPPLPGQPPRRAIFLTQPCPPLRHSKWLRQHDDKGDWFRFAALNDVAMSVFAKSSVGVVDQYAISSAFTHLSFDGNHYNGLVLREIMNVLVNMLALF